MPSSSNVILQVSDILAAIPVCRTTIYNAIKAGHLKITKVGRRTLFLSADVDAWLANGGPTSRRVTPLDGNAAASTPAWRSLPVRQSPRRRRS